jgi:DHA1 family multidrug resistance protein-like MFS transporter
MDPMDPVDLDLEKAELDASLPEQRRLALQEHSPGAQKDDVGEQLNNFATFSDSSLTTSATMPEIKKHVTAMSRIHMHRSQHSRTVGGSFGGVDSKGPLPTMGAMKPYPPPLPGQEEYVVEFDGADDPLHAQNWPMSKKCVLTSQIKCN